VHPEADRNSQLRSIAKKEYIDNSLLLGNNVFDKETTMPAYKEIQREIKITHGFVPKTCWIAHVFELSGKKSRTAPNRVDASVRKYPCPAEKQPAIIEALRKLEQQDGQHGRNFL
jgi:hypothetical protein